MDSFSFEGRGCAKMKGLEVEMERLSQLVLVLVVGREEVGCASGSSGGGGVDDKVGEVMRDKLGRAHLNLGRG